MTPDELKRIAGQILAGKKLHEIDFGEPRLDLEEKLRNIDQAIRRYPFIEEERPVGQGPDRS